MDGIPFLASIYLWLKALHLVAVVCWFAALLYLPRLFVYHVMAEDQISKKRFELMERKLYRGIANPAMMASLTFGILLVLGVPAIAQGGWFHAKMALVVALVIYHIMCKAHMMKIAEGENTKSHVYFRWFNEVPALLLVLIAILVIVKPF